MLQVQAVRSEMTQYWRRHSIDSSSSLNAMMLDHNAEELTKEELPEIISYLPHLKGKTVLELGAGIGRYTRALADDAKSVTAVDFVESFIDQNKDTNSDKDNIEYVVADVTKLDLEETFDIVFSNWLLMYLSDEEVCTLMRNILNWVKVGEYVFLRESCFGSSGNFSRDENPTKYRTPDVYDALFRCVSVYDKETKQHYVLELVLSRSVDTYIRRKNNHGQIIWLMKKVPKGEIETHGFATFQEFLDNQQYSKNSILRYEKIFGRHYVSTGGEQTTAECVDMLNLQPGERVLDVGCGIGGSAFYMEKKHDVSVLGLDLSFNMIAIALERVVETGCQQVQFEVADATRRDYPKESFDVVYSRDTILHIEDKLALFKRFYEVMKPGGRLLISDYCCGAKEHTKRFQKYVKSRGYYLLTPEKYGEVLEKANFVNVRAEDMTEMFTHVLNRELRDVKKMKDAFIEEFNEEDYNYIVDGWTNKLTRCSDGDQKWGWFYAEKPKL